MPPFSLVSDHLWCTVESQRLAWFSIRSVRWLGRSRNFLCCISREMKGVDGFYWPHFVRSTLQAVGRSTEDFFAFFILHVLKNFFVWKGENGKIKSNDLAKVCFSFFRRTRSTLLVFGGSEEWRMELTPDACCAEESVTGIYFGILTIEKRKEATTAEWKVFLRLQKKMELFSPQVLKRSTSWRKRVPSAGFPPSLYSTKPSLPEFFTLFPAHTFQCYGARWLPIDTKGRFGIYPVASSFTFCIGADWSIFGDLLF